MQLSSGSHIPDGLLAAIALRNENSRLGVPNKNPALHQGINACNSTIVLGLQSTAALNRIRSRCTGKERDTESGNDYFGARYFGSSMGRFMSPDWSGDLDTVPYADFGNPQSLNLYSYVQNNPMSQTDPDGHDVVLCATSSTQCYRLSDDQWDDIQKQIAAGNGGGVTAGKGFEGTGTIMCGGTACGTATYVDLGVNDLTGSQLGGVAVGMGIGKAFSAAWGAVAGWFGKGASGAAGAAVGDAAGTETAQIAGKFAGWYNRTFQTTAGQVRVIFEVTPEGNTAVLTDVDIFPEGGNVTNQVHLDVGTAEMKQIQRGIFQDLKEEGYDAVRVTPQYRVGGSNAGSFTKEFTVKIR
jgi:RHS repeat-associated protein